MAELIVVSKGELAVDKPGRHSSLKGILDLVIVREVAAARSHIPNYSETKKGLSVVARQFNGNPAFSEAPVTEKAFPDCYKCLQDQYSLLDDKNQRLSDVGGGTMWELVDQLIS